MGHVDVVVLSCVRWFRGLTYVIWAENGGPAAGKRKGKLSAMRNIGS
jgi:hypothetical protein